MAESDLSAEVNATTVLPAPSLSFANGWPYRKEVTIDHTKVDADLTDFPVTVHLDSDSDLADHAQSSGDDIRFEDANGTQLSHEIESYDGATGTLWAHVKVPSLSGSSDTTLYVYYGNSDAANQESVADVWDSNTRGAWHLDESASGTGNTGVYRDSTANNNHGTDNVSASGQTGQVYEGQQLDGADDFIEIPDDSALAITQTDITVSGWVSIDQNKDYNMGILGAKTADGYKAGSFYTYARKDGEVYWSRGDGNNFKTISFDASLPTGTLTHLAIVQNGLDVTLYVNGSEYATKQIGDASLDNVSEPLLLGARGDGFDYYDGALDEYRLSDTARSLAWISTTYANQNDPLSFYTVGSEESGGGPSIDSNGDVVVSWSNNDDSSDGGIDVERKTASSGAFGGGSGTQSDPYLIQTWIHLNEVRNYADSYFQLDNHLHQNVSGYADVASDSANGGNGWQPITSFSGTFDGNGKAIFDLNIHRASENQTALFGDITSSGTVTDVLLTEVDIEGNSNVAAVVGNNNGTVKRVGVGQGNVLGQANGTDGFNVGGVVGNNAGTISETYTHVTVDENSSSYDSRAGGFGGANKATIENSFATGLVDTGDYYSGGFLGRITDTETDAYWDTESSGKSSSPGNATGLTTSEMSGSSATSNMALDYTGTWETVESSDGDVSSDGYPILQTLQRDVQLMAQGAIAVSRPTVSLYTDVATGLSPSTTSYTDTTASGGTTYEYRIERNTDHATATSGVSDPLRVPKVMTRTATCTADGAVEASRSAMLKTRTATMTGDGAADASREPISKTRTAICTADGAVDAIREPMSKTRTATCTGDGAVHTIAEFSEALGERLDGIYIDYDPELAAFVTEWYNESPVDERQDLMALRFTSQVESPLRFAIESDVGGDGMPEHRSPWLEFDQGQVPRVYPSVPRDADQYRVLMRGLRKQDILRSIDSAFVYD